MTIHTLALIVDDDPDIRDLLIDYMSDFNIECVGVDGGRAMRAAMALRRFDIVILDLMLPGEDGLSLCRQLRGGGEVPILMLTARGEAPDKVACLEVGADDYVIKPFDPRELVARIRAILRRGRTEGRSPPQESGDEVRFSGWRLDRATRQLTSPQQVLIPLSNGEFRLLWAFLEKPQRVLNRDELLDAARGRSMEAFDRTIDLLVSRLRQKLERGHPEAPRLLRTVRGEGYLFDSLVER